MKELVGGFQEVSGNGIIVDREGRTLCAVFTGKFGVQPSNTKTIMDALLAWKEDESARVPGPVQGQSRKRSYDQRNYVSPEFFSVQGSYRRVAEERKINILCSYFGCTQDAALHYGWAVPAGGNTALGERAIPQKYLEIEKLVAGGKTGVLGRWVRNFDKTMSMICTNLLVVG
jgi:hypothetical protein